MTELKPLRVPIPVIVALTVMILACAGTDDSGGYYYEDTTDYSTPSTTPSTTPDYTPSYSTPSGPSAPSMPSYAPEWDRSRPPDYPKTANVSLNYTEPAIPDNKTFFQDLVTSTGAESYRGNAEAFVNESFSIMDTTAILISEAAIRYNSDGSSTRYAHGLAIITFDSSKRYSFSGGTVSTADRYLLGYGYMRDGYLHGPWWFNYVDHARAGNEGSKVHMVAEYRNGVANGECRWWTREGYFNQRAWFSNGQMHGTCTQWDDDSTTQSEYVNGTAYGTYQEWDTSGALTVRTQIYGDKYYGRCEYWYPASDYRYIIRYHSLTGNYGWKSVYHAEGYLAYQAWVDEGAETGPHVSYFKSGKKEWEGTRSNGKAQGVYNLYNEAGWAEFHIEYKDGVRDGVYKRFYQSGKLWWQGRNVAGVREGEYIDYREDGTISARTNYKGDKLNGAYIAYDTAGNETAHDIYEDGNWVRSELAPTWPDPVLMTDAAGNEIRRTYGRWRPQTQDEMPPMEVSMGMVWSKALGGIVMFGGRAEQESTYQLFAQTWLRKDGTWQRIFADGPTPSARDYPAMAYDSARGVVVLFGGRDPEGKPLGDTWELSADGWKQVTPADNPQARAGAGMAYDTRRGVCVMFGGLAGTTSLSETHEWDGTNWKAAAPASSPAARFGHAMAYDEDRGLVVVQGGTGASGVLGDTFAYDGNRWIDCKFWTDDEALLTSHAMVYDTDARRMVLLGHDAVRGFKPLVPDFGWLTDSEWTFIDERLSPPMRWEFGAAYDPAAREIIVFGGRSDNGQCRETLTLGDETAEDREADIREFVDTRLAAPGWTWIDNGAFAASRFSSRALVYDPARKAAVLFGGWSPEGLGNETHEFTAGKWTQKQPANSPPARSSPVTWFDETRGKVMIHAGWGTDAAGATVLLTDLWEWDGTNWKRLRENVPGMPAQLWSWTYDAKRGVVVAFASAVKDGPRALFEFNGTAWKQVDAGEPAEKLSGGYWVYDAAAAKCLYYGAYNPETFETDYRGWYWDGKYWEESGINFSAGEDYIGRLCTDTAGGALWRIMGTRIQRLKDGAWTTWKAPSGLASWVGQMWIDPDSGHLFFHGTTHSLNHRNDTLEFDPEQGEPGE